MTEQEMIDIPLHSSKGDGAVYVTRVVGGWIYYAWDYKKDNPVDVGTFVPLTVSTCTNPCASDPTMPNTGMVNLLCCGNCKYCTATDKPGYCKRHAPVVYRDRTGPYPRVKSTHWCGDWERGENSNE